MHWCLRLVAISIVVAGAAGACTRSGFDIIPDDGGVDDATGFVAPPDMSRGPVVFGAFPSAEGFGAAATGGRGGSVIYVTTLAASGPGSLQAALDAVGPRTILFTVSGVIPEAVIVTHGDVTIAGQSSPGGIELPGLLIQGDVVCDTAACALPSSAPSNFIVRHLRIRPGAVADGNGNGDGLRLHHAQNGIIDHVSVGNATARAVEIAFTSDVTIQYSLFAETIGDNYEVGGMLIDYSDPTRGFPLTRLSIHHNMWNRIFGRMPEVSRENIVDDQPMDLELANNVLWDTQRPIKFASTNPTSMTGLDYHLNLVGNRSVQNPANDQCFGLVEVDNGPDAMRPSFTAASTIYFAGNHVNRSVRTDYELIYNGDDFCASDAANLLAYGNDASTRPANALAVRHAFPTVSYDASDDSLTVFLAKTAGGFPRDAMDTRLMANPLAGSFASAMPNVNPANDQDTQPFDEDSPPTAPLDTDGDGMPDTWEQQNGLDAHDASDGNTTTLSMPRFGVAGFTNLEVYLSDLSDAVIAAPPYQPQPTDGS